jgi:membrane protein implicated in regulation of membrane protease activity
VERFSLITVLKYLGGILLAQAAAVVMAIAAFQTGLLEHWGAFAVFALLIGIFAALWFAAIASGTRHHAVARGKDDFAR